MAKKIYMVVGGNDGTHYINCKHHHKTLEAAQACMDKLQSTYKDNSVAACWYRARIEELDVVAQHSTDYHTTHNGDGKRRRVWRLLSNRSVYINTHNGWRVAAGMDIPASILAVKESV